MRFCCDCKTLQARVAGPRATDGNHDGGGERASGGGLQRFRRRRHVASCRRQLMEVVASGAGSRTFMTLHVLGYTHYAMRARAEQSARQRKHTARQDGKRREVRRVEEGHAAGRGMKTGSVRRAEPLQDSERVAMIIRVTATLSVRLALSVRAAQLMCGARAVGPLARTQSQSRRCDTCHQVCTSSHLNHPTPRRVAADCCCFRRLPPGHRLKGLRSTCWPGHAAAGAELLPPGHGKRQPIELTAEDPDCPLCRRSNLPS